MSCENQYPPTSGRWSEYLSSGPMCRYAEDLLPMLKIMAGPNVNMWDPEMAVELISKLLSGNCFACRDLICFSYILRCWAFISVLVDVDPMQDTPVNAVGDEAFRRKCLTFFHMFTQVVFKHKGGPEEAAVLHHPPRRRLCVHIPRQQRADGHSEKGKKPLPKSSNHRQASLWRFQTHYLLFGR